MNNLDSGRTCYTKSRKDGFLPLCGLFLQHLPNVCCLLPNFWHILPTCTPCLVHYYLAKLLLLLFNISPGKSLLEFSCSLLQLSWPQLKLSSGLCSLLHCFCCVDTPQPQEQEQHFSSNPEWTPMCRNTKQLSLRRDLLRQGALWFSPA